VFTVLTDLANQERLKTELSGPFRKCLFDSIKGSDKFISLDENELAQVLRNEFASLSIKVFSLLL